MLKIIFLVLSISFFISENTIIADEKSYSERPEVSEFVDTMHEKHGFNKQQLFELLSNSEFQERVVRIMDRQPEGTMTWGQYKRLIITRDRIALGKQFIQTYSEDLERAEDIFGIPSEIIASIIGIETRYGKTLGNVRVIDSLMTLSFDYPRRAKFFISQLEDFLLLAREEKLDASKIKGSIAGAMGYGQFMPDSYRLYAVDFDFDGKRDILSNPVDAIGSVANFLSKKGKWVANTEIVLEATLKGKRPEIKSAFKPYLSIYELEKIGIKPLIRTRKNTLVAPIELEDDMEFEYWLGLNNYHALSRYNRSKLYVMAVYQFSKSLK